MPEASNDFVWAVVGSPAGLFVMWLLVINLAAFLVFGWDKLMAKCREKHEKLRRVPEKTLFLLALLGGSAGALLGMRVWRHKTLHKTFRFGIPLILILQVVLSTGLYLYVTVIR